jgi:hypothetical protein
VKDQLKILSECLPGGTEENHLFLSQDTQPLDPGTDPLDRRLIWPQSRSGHRGKRKNPLPQPGIEPRSPDRPARSQILYCLSYPAPVYRNRIQQKHIFVVDYRTQAGRDFQLPLFSYETKHTYSSVRACDWLAFHSSPSGFYTDSLAWIMRVKLVLFTAVGLHPCTNAIDHRGPYTDNTVTTAGQFSELAQVPKL